MPKKRTSLAAVADAMMADRLDAKAVMTTGAKLGGQPAKAGKKAAPVAAAKQTRNAIVNAERDAELVRTSVYIPLIALKKLKELALLAGPTKKVNEFFMEGIDKVFAAHGLPSIAEMVSKNED